MKVAYLNTGTGSKSKSKRKPDPQNLQSLSNLVSSLILANELKNAVTVIGQYIKTAEIINEEAQKQLAVRALMERMDKLALRRYERKKKRKQEKE